MSCILEDKQGYENLAATLFNFMTRDYGDRNSIRHCFYFAFKINELDQNTHEYYKKDSIYKEKLTEFCKMLYTYNKVAYNERYKETESGKDLGQFKLGDSKLKCENAHVHIFQSLRFVDYQCSDSEEYCQSETRQTLDKLCAKMGEIAIRRSHAYESAQWGLPL